MKNGKRTLDQLVPPGAAAEGEIGTLWGLWIFAAFEILFRGPGVFVPEILRQKEAGAKADSFFAYFSGPMWFAPVLMVLPVSVLILLLYLTVKVMAHYRFYRRGSRADYTMKRLPDPREYHRRALAIPLFGLIGTVLVYLIVLALDIAIYYLMTPGWMEPKLF